MTLKLSSHAPAPDGTVLEVIDVGAHSVRSVRIIPAPAERRDSQGLPPP